MGAAKGIGEQGALFPLGAMSSQSLSVGMDEGRWGELMDGVLLVVVLQASAPQLSLRHRPTPCEAPPLWPQCMRLNSPPGAPFLD